LIAAQKTKPTTVWQWVRLKLITGRLSPNARTNARAATTLAGVTGVHRYQVAHKSIHYMNSKMRAREDLERYDAFRKSGLTCIASFGYKHCTMMLCCQTGRTTCCCCCGMNPSGAREIVG
jgi:hypothetical protein